MSHDATLTDGPRPAGGRIHDLPLHERPRERLLRDGPDGLRQAELLAVLLRTGSRGCSVLQAADTLLSRFGSLAALARAGLDELRKVRGIGPDKAATLMAAFALGRQMEVELRAETPLLDNPAAVARLVRESLRLLTVETFSVVLVNTRRRLLRIERITQGTLDSLLVHPREVFRAAITAGAAAVILVHNHPSGDPTPSEADVRTTRDLIRAGQLLKIEVLDHVILGRATPDRPRDYVSLRELGHFYA